MTMKVQECCCLYLNFKKSKPALHFVSISQVRFAYGEKHMHAITENNISSQSRLGASSQNNNETNVKIMKNTKQKPWLLQYSFQKKSWRYVHNLLYLLLLQGLLPGVLVNLGKIGHIFRLLYFLGRLRCDDSGWVSTEAFNMEDAELEKKVRLKTTDERQACSS